MTEKEPAPKDPGPVNATEDHAETEDSNAIPEKKQEGPTVRVSPVVDYGI
ncbi:hypothetical protein LTV02_13365 [Nocardia yamanashiensis]|nr:hypothetical protein [Nocardia yamanashiensis]UGT44316.1 hypothetical protein LTV02_13365 [Nocardia yamanashiensis]